MGTALLVAMGGIGVVSYFLEYIHAEKVHIQEAKSVNREVDEAVATYLDNYPHGVVFCARDEIGKFCYQSYSYNRCFLGRFSQDRDEASWWTHGGRIRFLATVGEAFEVVRAGGGRRQWPDHGLFVGTEERFRKYTTDGSFIGRKKIVSRNGIEVSLVSLPKEE